MARRKRNKLGEIMVEGIRARCVDCGAILHAEDVLGQSLHGGDYYVEHGLYMLSKHFIREVNSPFAYYHGVIQFCYN